MLVGVGGCDCGICGRYWVWEWECDGGPRVLRLLLTASFGLGVKTRRELLEELLYASGSIHSYSQLFVAIHIYFSSFTSHLATS